MKMYDELVKRLRERAAWINYGEEYPTEDVKLMTDAADAIEELQVPKWIPVTERLPTEKGRYLTAYADGYVTENDWCFIGLMAVGWCYDRDAVTHWMPLPEPPKGDGT